MKGAITQAEPIVLDDDGSYEDLSGTDLDLFGDGTPVTSCLMPDPASGVKDCPGKNDEGTCPKDCAMCDAFQLELSNWLRMRRMESQ